MMDKGYIDFGRLYAFTRQMAFFVTGVKKKLDYCRRKSRAVDKIAGLRSHSAALVGGDNTQGVGIH